MPVIFKPSPIKQGTSICNRCWNFLSLEKGMNKCVSNDRRQTFWFCNKCLKLWKKRFREVPEKEPQMHYPGTVWEPKEPCKPTGPQRVIPRKKPIQPKRAMVRLKPGKNRRAVESKKPEVQKRAIRTKKSKPR